MTKIKDNIVRRKYGKNVFSKSSPILIWAKTIDEGNETNKNLSQNRSTILILLSQTDWMIWRSAKSFGHPAATRPDAKYFGIQCLLGWVKITGVGLIWRFYSTATKRIWLHGQKLKRNKVFEFIIILGILKCTTDSTLVWRESSN